MLNGIQFRNRRRLRGRRFGPQSIVPYALHRVSYPWLILGIFICRKRGEVNPVTSRVRNRSQIMLPRENRRISGIVARTPKVRRRRRRRRRPRRLATGEMRRRWSMCSLTGCRLS